MSSLKEFSYLSKSEDYIVKNFCNLDEYSIDVGAARGDFASQMSLYSKYVIAIEPNPLKIKELIKKRNNIRLISNPASSIHGKIVEFRVVSATPANSTIEPLNNLEGFDGIEIRQLTTVKVDEICNNNTSFVKIDCEGHDLDVLYGAENLIKNSNPSILVELRDKHNPGYLIKTFKFLLMMDYIPFLVNEENISEINIEDNLVENLENLIKNQETDNNTQDNFLFVHRQEHLSQIKKYI